MTVLTASVAMSATLVSIGLLLDALDADVSTLPLHIVKCCQCQAMRLVVQFVWC